jgi:hypothetical protein
MRSSRLLSVLAALASAFYFIWLLDVPGVRDHLVFYNFQNRDLLRATALLHGHWIYYGPEMSGGGTLPGPFYYFILAGCFLVLPTWLGAFAGMIALCTAGVTAVVHFFKKRGLLAPALLFVTLFVDSIVVEHVLGLFLNPSYLIAFVLVLLLLAALTFSLEAVEGRVRTFLAAALITGFAIQIHFQCIFIFLAMLFMQGFSAGLRLPRLPRRVVLYGLALLILPSVPFVIGLTLHHFGVEWGQPAPFTGSATHVWPTYYYLLGQLKTVPWENLWHVFWFQTVRVFPWTLPLMAVVLAITRGEHVPQTANSRLLKPLWICAAFGFIPFSYVYLVPIANRYGLVFNFALLFITVIALAAYFRSARRLWILSGLSCVMLAIFWTETAIYFPHVIGSADGLREAIAILVVGSAAWFAESPSRKVRIARVAAFTLTVALSQIQSLAIKNELFQLGNMARGKQWMRIWHSIECATNWDYQTARERLYFVNAHIDEEPELAYQYFQTFAQTQPCPMQTPDGFLLTFMFPAHTEIEMKDWLLSQPIAADLKTALKNDEIKLGPFERARISIVPYYVTSEAHLPKHFHDIGISYESRGEFAVLAQIAGQKGAAALDKSRAIFKWNDCPEHDHYCDYGAVISVQRVDARTVDAKVRIIGGPISQISPWIHPTWTQGLVAPFVRLECGGKSVSATLIGALGFDRNNFYFDPISNFFLGNNSIVAPFEKTVRMPCSGALETVGFGYSGSKVDHLRESISLPGEELSATMK